MSETNLFHNLFAIMAGDASVATKGFAEFQQYVKDAKQASKHRGESVDQSNDSIPHAQKTTRTPTVKTKA